SANSIRATSISTRRACADAAASSAHAAPEAAAPAPEPAPEAPPLPFRYLGRVEEAGRPTVVFLARDDEVLAVHPGDSIDSAYRLIRLNDDEVYFLYRPLKIEQALSMGNTT
ncbi:MAG TPA: hypothetical protein VF096_02450, partial [Azonexus sp.]